MGNGSKTYSAWLSMKTRCYNTKQADYPRYGGRGITVSDEWKNNYSQFLADMGERPEGMTLERIDNSKGYSKDNCKWATRKEQARNLRSNVLITYQTESLTLAEWAERLGCHPGTLQWRVSNGWSAE